MRYEVNAVMHGGAPVCETPWCTEQSACSHVEWGGAKSIWQARFSKHENPNMPDKVLDHPPRKAFRHYVYKCGGPFKFAKAGSTLRSSRAVPHPSTNRALRRLTSEVGRDPVRSTRYGRQRYARCRYPTRVCRGDSPIHCPVYLPLAVAVAPTVS